jgi:glycosyltransferase involved in cell wall biosynthesis
VPQLSATIITLNEAAHIAAAIRSVSWADEVLVVDSGSTDDTVTIARAEGARVESRAWTGWVDQNNHAAGLATYDWILSLDADERVTNELASEIRALMAAGPSHAAYRIPRVTFHLGRWIRTTDFYPDFQTRLYDRRHARWRGTYVHESVSSDSPPGRLTHELQHFSFANLADHLDRLNRYSTLAARQLYEGGRRTSIAGVMLHPVGAFVRNYLLRRGFLDGTAGLTLSAVNAYGVFIKMAKLHELQRRAPGTPDAADPKLNLYT